MMWSRGAVALLGLIRPLSFTGAHRQKGGRNFSFFSYSKCRSALRAQGLSPAVVLALQCLHRRSLVDSKLSLATATVASQCVCQASSLEVCLASFCWRDLCRSLGNISIRQKEHRQ